MRKVEMKIIVHQYDSLDELEISDRKLVEQAVDSAKKAYAPYSKFRVGAALMLMNGEVITGNNQENAAYPSGLCAERVALFYANAQFPETPVVSMAITAFHDGEQVKDAVYPCGSCRQVILEDEIRFNNDVRMILAGKEKIIVVESVKKLLPLYFDDSVFTK
jgi:cytidine deaminase